MNTQSFCPDCGSNDINHFNEYVNASLETYTLPFAIPLGRVWRFFSSLVIPRRAPNALAFFMLDSFAKLGWARVTTAPEEKDALMTRALFESAAKRGIDMKQYILFNRRRGLCTVSRDGYTHCFNWLPRPAGPSSHSFDWMDNKAVLKRRFSKAGIPVARGGAYRTVGQALKAFRSLEKPVITKPHLGSASRHTTLHIFTEPQLKAGFRAAKKLSPYVIVEEELVGAVYRATVIGGRVVGVIRRDQPQVVGNGRFTVSQLVELENAHPSRQHPPFSKITLQPSVAAELTRQGLAWESVPERGRVVTLHPKINWSTGGTTADVTASTHAETIALFERIGAFLGDALVGIDFIIADISKPWQEQARCGVIECNTLPFIDNHHYPFTGEPRDAAGALLELALKH